MSMQRQRLSGNADLMWVALTVAICAVFATALLSHLNQRHEVYQLGYDMTEQTSEHALLLEENRRLVVEAALQGSVERIEEEALLRLGLRPTEQEQVVRGQRQ